jgi:hypothetical protein
MINFFISKKTRVSLLPVNWEVSMQDPQNKFKLETKYHEITTWCKMNLRKTDWHWIKSSNKISNNWAFYTIFHRPTMIDFKNPEDALMVKILFGL